MTEQTSFLERYIVRSPKMMSIVKIDPVLACNLNALWHSRLPYIHWSNVTRNRNFICFGALFELNYYAVGIWSSPVNRSFDFDTVLELRRLATAPDAPKYTCTYMIGKMVKAIKTDLPNIIRLISYQDTEVHDGTIYKASNWTPVEEVKFTSWTNSVRNRRPDQSTASKIRWEYHL